jgi:Protein of unknown function (DUF1616)
VRRPGALVAAAAAVVFAVATQASLPVAVSVLVAVPLVLVLPGYALLEALRSAPLDGGQRLVLVPALSVALDIAVALVVNFIHSGLTARSWAIGIAAVAVAAAVVALLRGADDGLRPERSGIRLRWVDLAAFALTGAVLIGAVVVARTPVSAKRAQGYTILSVVRGPKSTVKVDVQSGELETKRYRLLVAGNHVVYRNTTFRLAPGARLAKSVTIADPHNAIRATLYLVGSKRPYRHVFLR